MDNDVSPDAVRAAALARDIAKVRGDLAAAVGEAGVAVALFGAPEPATIADLDTALAYLQLTPLPRDGDRFAFTDDGWRNPKALAALIKAGDHLTQLRGQARALFNETGLIADYTAIRADIATKSGKLFRFLDGGYKRHIARLRSYLRGPLPKAPAERLKIADLALSLKQAEADFARLEAAGRAFGALWRGADSDWSALDNVLRWRQSYDRLPASVWPKLAEATEGQLATGDRARRALHAALSSWRRGMDAIAARLDLDLDRAFGDRAFGPGEPAINPLMARYGAWLDHME